MPNPRGPHFYRATAPIAPGQHRLRGLPVWEPGAPNTWPTTDRGVFTPPGGGGIPGGSFAPPPPAGGVGTSPNWGPGSQSFASGDWRLPNLNNFLSFAINPSLTQPVLPTNFHRSYILVQNNDPVFNVLISFGVQPNSFNTIVLTPSLGIIFDSVVPYTTMYVAAASTLTVNPSGIEGTEVSPLTIPQGV